MNKYIAKVKINVADGDGDKVKKVTEVYLVNAESVTDAEALVYKDFDGETLDWELISVVKSPILKVIPDTTKA